MREKPRTANSTYPKVAVQWLNQVLYFHQSLCLVDSEVLRNRHLRVAAKRCSTFKKTNLNTRIYILTILSLVLFISCKNDPNKQVDEGVIINNKYHSKEIGWTIEIPEGWNITKRDETQKREDKGLKLINEANGIEYDASGLKQLISFQKDRIHSFAATSEKFEIEYVGEYEENKILVKELIYNTYASNGIKVDTVSSKEKIDNLSFDLFKIIVYDTKGDVLLYQDLYSTFRNGLDFGVNLNYINEKEKMELIRVWKNSKFE